MPPQSRYAKVGIKPLLMRSEGALYHGVLYIWGQIIWGLILPRGIIYMGLIIYMGSGGFMLWAWNPIGSDSYLRRE
jgi:hypothetical protein